MIVTPNVPATQDLFPIVAERMIHADGLKTAIVNAQKPAIGTPTIQFGDK